MATINAADYEKEARSLIALAEEDAYCKASPSETVHLRAAAALAVACAIYCAEHDVDLNIDDAEPSGLDVN